LAAPSVISFAQSFIALLVSEPCHHVSAEMVSQIDIAGGWFAGAFG
jgi:hypothetical protein